MKWSLFWSLSFILLGGSPVSASSGGVLGLTPEEKTIHDAASIHDPLRREAALRSAIRDSLLSVDPAVRDRVFSYLSQNSRWIDLRPFDGIIEQFSKIDPLHRGLWLLDDNQLARAPRDERLVAYRTAILAGEARLARGRPLTRESAMAFAAADGMAEIEPLVTQFLPAVEERWKKSFRFEALPTLFQLGDGAKDREDAGRVAATRLGAMDDREFASRMKSDGGFRTAALQVARDVCAPNPFDGTRNSGCARMSELVTRQTSLDLEIRKAPQMEHSVSQPETTESTADWLSQLRARVPVAEIVNSNK